MPFQPSFAGIPGTTNQNSGCHSPQTKLAQSIGVDQQSLLNRMPMLMNVMSGILNITQTLVGFGSPMASPWDRTSPDEDATTEHSSPSPGKYNTNGISSGGFFWGSTGNAPISPIFGVGYHGGSSSNSPYKGFAANEYSNSPHQASGHGFAANIAPSFPTHAFGNPKSGYCGGAGSSGYSFPYISGPYSSGQPAAGDMQQPFLPNSDPRNSVPRLTSTINPIRSGLPGGEQIIGQVADEPLSQIRNLDYTQLGELQRWEFNGVSRNSAAIIHLGGRANISGRVSDNGVSPSAMIYNNVMQSPDKFHPAEVDLVKAWSRDELQRRGIITGEDLDHAFINEMGLRDGITPQILELYHQSVDLRVSKMLANPNREGVLADTKKPLNIVDDMPTLQDQSGMTPIEQAIFRLAGHAVLFSGDGRVNGDILPITMGNANALDNHGVGNNGSVDSEAKALLDADMADDGLINGSSLRTADAAVLAKLYLNGPGVTNNQQIIDHGIRVGLANGRTPQQIKQAIANGSQQALNDFKRMAKNHTPAMLALGATMAGAVAVCPFLGGMAATATSLSLLSPQQKD